MRFYLPRVHSVSSLIQGCLFGKWDMEGHLGWEESERPLLILGGSMRACVLELVSRNIHRIKYRKQRMTNCQVFDNFDSRGRRGYVVSLHKTCRILSCACGCSTFHVNGGNGYSFPRVLLTQSWYLDQGSGQLKEQYGYPSTIPLTYLACSK